METPSPRADRDGFGPALLIVALLVVIALTALSPVAGAGTASQEPRHTPPSGGAPAPSDDEPQVRNLGGGKYEAIIPASGPAAADTSDLAPAADGYVDYDNPGVGYCTQNHLDAYYFRDEFGDDHFKWFYIGFNLSTIPGNATVSSASLGLYLDSAAGATVTISAHRVTGGWTCPSWSAKPGYDGSPLASRSVGIGLGFYT